MLKAILDVRLLGGQKAGRLRRRSLDREDNFDSVSNIVGRVETDGRTSRRKDNERLESFEAIERVCTSPKSTWSMSRERMEVILGIKACLYKE